MENDVILNIDLSTIENKLDSVIEVITVTQGKILELHQIFAIFLGLIIGLSVGYIFVKVGFDGD